MNLSPPILHQTFDSFLRGPENAEAFELAIEFCKCSEAASPFVIIGPSGEGKTHLLQAVVRNLWRQSRSAILFSASFDRKRIPITAAVDHILVDDLSALLQNNTVESRHRILGINNFLDSKKKFLMACVSSSGDMTGENLLGLWPKAKIAEISSSGLDLRLKLGMEIGQHVPANLLLEIAKASRSLREVEGWIIRYDACKELGEPFNLKEGY